MTRTDDKEPFLSRWARRKLEAKAPGSPAEPPVAAPAAPATKTDAAQAPQDAGPEYREFFDPQVEEKLRRAALKKLFSDPHFNAMDGLDTYIDDYAKADPIPEAMLRQLRQAEELLLFRDEDKRDGGADTEAAPAPSSAAKALPPGANALSDDAVAAATPAARASKND